MKPRKVTTTRLVRMKQRGEPIAMVTAYDATFARLLDEAGVDVLLVGDSAGMVVQGHDDTLRVTLDHMVYHTAAVARGRRRALLVADMPFLTYQTGPVDALRNAGRLLAEGGAEAVKLEGGRAVVPVVRALVEAGIPVMGHIGLTPQSVHQFGGYKVQGRDAEGARRLLADARALEEAGCFALVLELVPGVVAATITEALHIPTIGIGAGPQCDGQVLVCYDLLGLNEGFRPRFLKVYDELGDRVRQATAAYVQDVKARRFPTEAHTFDAAAGASAAAPAGGGNGTPEVQTV